MSHEQIEYYLQFIKQQLLFLRENIALDWEAVDAALEDLQVTYEQMQINSEAIEATQEELLQQKQYYQDLFQFFPIASLVTDANGLILEANQAIAQLLNVSHNYLVGKPLALFVAEGDDPLGNLGSNRSAFRTRLNQLSQSTGTQTWRVSLCRNRETILAELHVAISRNTDGLVDHLRVGVYDLSQSQETIASVTEKTSMAPQLPEGVIEPLQQPRLDVVSTQSSMSQLPRSLDGLQVLVVDDEADIRDFLTTVLEANGIVVRAVASAAAALEELERFRPDVVLSDIRMPGESGYHLIQQIRAIEAEKGGHLPAAAITAYLDEDREKSLQAGFEAHLYKLVQPDEWVEVVTQLARQRSDSKQDF